MTSFVGGRGPQTTQNTVGTVAGMARRAVGSAASFHDAWRMRPSPEPSRVGVCKTCQQPATPPPWSPRLRVGATEWRPKPLLQKVHKIKPKVAQNNQFGGPILLTLGTFWDKNYALKSRRIYNTFFSGLWERSGEARHAIRSSRLDPNACRHFPKNTMFVSDFTLFVAPKLHKIAPVTAKTST